MRVLLSCSLIVLNQFSPPSESSSSISSKSCTLLHVSLTRQLVVIFMSMIFNVSVPSLLLISLPTFYISKLLLTVPCLQLNAFKSLWLFNQAKTEFVLISVCQLSYLKSPIPLCSCLLMFLFDLSFTPLSVCTRLGLMSVLLLSCNNDILTQA